MQEYFRALNPLQPWPEWDIQVRKGPVGGLYIGMGVLAVKN